MSEDRYLKSIISLKDKESVYGYISRSIFLFYFGFSFLILSFIGILGLSVFFWFDTKVASILIVLIFIFIIIALISIVFSEKDPLSSRQLNIRMYIYLSVLEEYITKNEHKEKLRVINRRIVNCYNILIENLENTFIFHTSTDKFDLIYKLREFSISDFIGMYKNGDKELLLNLIQSIKETYYYSEKEMLYPTIDGDSANIIYIQIIDDALSECSKHKQTIKNKNRIMNKISEAIKNPIFLTILLVLCTIILFVYMNTAKDYSKIPANIAIFALMITFIFPIWTLKRNK